MHLLCPEPQVSIAPAPELPTTPPGDCPTGPGSSGTEHSIQPSEHKHLPTPDGSEQPSSWVRLHQGRCHRLVLINHLPQHQAYNGRWGWVDAEHLESCANDPSRLVPVFLGDSSPPRTLRVQAQYLFLAGPLLRPGHEVHPLVVVDVLLTPPQGGKVVHARLIVDTGCQLDGVLSADFVNRHGWATVPSHVAVRAANGTRTVGIRHCFVNSHLAPGFTRKVKYGILDLPGYDGLIGMGFLTQFQPFSIAVSDDAHRSLTLTLPTSGQAMTIPSIPFTWPKHNHQTVAPEDRVEVQFQTAPPSQEDLRHVLSAFFVQCTARHTSVQVIDASGAEPEHAAAPEVTQDTLAQSERVTFLTMGAREDDDPLDPQIQAKLETLLAQFRPTVSPECEYPPFPPEREISFNIQLQPDAQIPASPVHKLSPALVTQLRSMLQELLHNGLIVPSNSQFAAPLLMVRKPDGTYRICIDYRKLNAVTIKDKYPLPNPTMIFDRLAGCKYFSKLDLRWGYWQIRMHPDAVDRTAFRTPMGSFAWRVMGMGLSNAAPTFQRLMDSLFRDLEFVSAYLDDIIIASRSAEEHLRHLETVLHQLHQHQLIARESKCAFFQTEVQFLGYKFSQNGKEVDPNKTTALLTIAPPTTVHALQQWLGAIKYYSSFIDKNAHIIAPLTDLLKGTQSTRKHKCLARLPWKTIH